MQARTARWLAFTLAMVALGVVPYFLFTTQGWDGWPHYVLVLRGEGDAAFEHMLANARPLGGWTIVQSMTLLGATFGPRIAMCMCIAGMAASVFMALRVKGLASAREAALVAVLTVCIPAVQTIMAAPMLQYFIGGFAFFAGLWCFLAADAAVGVQRVSLYIAACGLAIAAALFGEAPAAMLPLYPLLLAAQRAGGLSQPKAAITRWRELLLHSAPVVLGVTALAVQLHLFPDYGPHAGAHDIVRDPARLLRYAGTYAWALGRCTWPLLLALAFAWGTSRWQRCRPVLQASVIGWIALALGLLPYWLAGRVPAVLDWDLRFLLFSGFGLGLVALAVLREACGSAKWAIVLVCIAAAFSASWRAPLWAVRQVTDDAVMLAARERLDPHVHLVLVTDPGRVVARPYRHYEWTSMMQLATGRRNILALNAGQEDELARWEDYFRNGLRMLEGPLPAGACTARMALPLRDRGFVWTAWEGMAAKWRGGEGYAQWLRRNLTVSVTCR